MKTGYYAVVRGRCTGVYKTWPECERQVKGYRNARYKKFVTQSDALAFILQNNATGRTGNEKSSQFELPSTIELQKSSCSQLVSQEQNMWEKVPVVYTDGACLFNGRVGAAAGIGIYWGEQHVDNISEPLLNGPLTNNRAELTAVIKAIQTAIQRGYQQLIVCTDSNLLIQTMNSWIHHWRKNGWKTSNGIAVKNQDLIIQLNGLLENINVLSNDDWKLKRAAEIPSIARAFGLNDSRYVSNMFLDIWEYLETKKQTSLPEKEQLAVAKSNSND